MAVAPHLVFHADLAADIEAVVAFYRDVDASLPTKFRARFREQIERLRTFPDSGAILFDDFRRIVIKRFPYLVVYRVVGDQVHVLAVISFRRGPEAIRNAAVSRSGES